MKTKIYLIIQILTILIVTQMTWANGIRVGNGGVGFLCTREGGVKVMTLDLFEMGFSRPEGFAKMSREEILKSVLNNLKRLAPKLGDQYEKRLAGLMQDVEFKKGAVLTRSDDSLHVAVPRDCEIKQLALRRLQSDSMTKPFVFDEDLWNKMDASEQAALSLHEVLYEHFAKLGEKDSVKVRKVVGYLMSERSTTDLPEKFWSYIRELKIPIYR